MTFQEALTEVLERPIFTTIWIILGAALILAGIAIYIGIKTNGKVLVIDQLFKKKNFNREVLKKKYLIQAYYTVGFGIVLILITVVFPINPFVLLGFLLLMGIGDFTYDYLAIKSATEPSEEAINEL